MRIHITGIHYDQKQKIESLKSSFEKFWPYFVWGDINYQVREYKCREVISELKVVYNEKYKKSSVGGKKL